MKSLEGRVALVTGSSSGIGAAIALSFAESGAAVAITYARAEAAALRVVAGVESKGVNATAFKCDVGSDEQVRAMVDHAVHTLGSLDILVNNAGVTHWIDNSDLEAMTEDKWDDIMQVNLKGAFFAARASMPHLKRSGRGAIINISSVSGITGSGSSIAYAVSKAGVISLTQSLARAFAPDVRVNAIAPGVVETRWLEGDPELRNKFIQRAPLHRVSNSEDIARTAVYLAEADGVTGQTLVVDNGYLLA